MSATMSSRLMPGRGSRLMFVMRMSGSRFQPSARTAPPLVAADARRRLTAGQIAAEDALADERHALRRDPLVIPAERAQAARRGGVGHEASPGPSRSGSRPRACRWSGSWCPRRRPPCPKTRSSSVGCPQLSWIWRYSCEGCRTMVRRPGGSTGAAEQLHGLLPPGRAHAPEVEAPDVLVAGGPVAAGLGEGATLQVVTARRRGPRGWRRRG